MHYRIWGNITCGVSALPDVFFNVKINTETAKITILTLTLKKTSGSAETPQVIFPQIR
jgi:hypothetical protein